MIALEHGLTVLLIAGIAGAGPFIFADLLSRLEPPGWMDRLRSASAGSSIAVSSGVVEVKHSEAERNT